MLATVVASLTPLDHLPDSGISDKLSHVLTYAFLGLWFSGVYQRSAAPRLGMLLFALGAAMEGVQAFTDSRSPEGADLLANLAGIALALALARAGLDRWCAMVEDLLIAGR